jgi:hypothetical protein
MIDPTPGPSGEAKTGAEKGSSSVILKTRHTVKNTFRSIPQMDFLENNIFIMNPLILKYD